MATSGVRDAVDGRGAAAKIRSARLGRRMRKRRGFLNYHDLFASFSFFIFGSTCGVSNQRRQRYRRDRKSMRDELRVLRDDN